MSTIKPQNILSIQNRDEFRQWLMTHHATERECWVKVKRGRPMDDGTFWYIDAVEEAMCFGWIDSTLKRLDGEAYQRFAPREPVVGTEQGTMPPHGAVGAHDGCGARRAARHVARRFHYRRGNPVSPPARPHCVAELPKLPTLIPACAHRHDTNQEKQRLLFENRLKKFIDNTRLGVMYGEWNDNGRLL